MSDVTILQGDCVEVMRGLPAGSVDAIVTDPPYELGFMGKRWDSSGIAYQVETWAEALRVLKPGGHLLAFGGTRTYHRMTVAIEDAGFEIRDCIQWLYGSGFPKSHDVSKAIDKGAGATREVVGHSPYAARKPNGTWTGSVYGDEPSHANGPTITAPATPEAERWNGWGTALKPANEPIVVSRKPLDEATVAANVLTHGTGAINIDGCRIAGEPWTFKHTERTSRSSGIMGNTTGARVGTAESNAGGRWPANVILDEAAAAMLDEQSGVLTSGARNGKHIPNWNDGTRNKYGGNDTGNQFAASSGGASRFFYVAKASRRERGDGNTHPTVKPVTLIRYLVRLVTPPGGTVLDPFAGSGTTGLAAREEGFNAVLIEREPEYVGIIRRRLAL